MYDSSCQGKQFTVVSWHCCWPQTEGGGEYVGEGYGKWGGGSVRGEREGTAFLGDHQLTNNMTIQTS